MDTNVLLLRIPEYNVSQIRERLPSELFDLISPTDVVLLKPNWVKESHLRKPAEWEYVITHPDVITAVLSRVCDRLGPGGKVIIADGPQTDSSFEKIIARYPVKLWKSMTVEKSISLEIIDLRDDEWIQEHDVVVNRKKLAGDPRGKTEFNLLDEESEFFSHQKSARGYYGADYNIRETNEAHDGHNNRYRLSRSVIEADVFINLPKLKTHKKAGITCCLKNLVGINVYKNFLPHHSEGGPSEAGDQFPADNLSTRVEGPMLAYIKQHFLHNPRMARMLKPFGKTARALFGKTENVIRSGNWYGNDTLWRMTLDLNKACLYGNPDGTLREDSFRNRKKYIGIVDAIQAGEGNGPLAPDPVSMGYILAGTNPVAIDAVCARLMGFDPLKIPTIQRAFAIKKHPICNFAPEEITITENENTVSLATLPDEMARHFTPQKAWKGFIEYERNNNH